MPRALLLLAALALAPAHAQERSLVSTRVAVTGEVRKERTYVVARATDGYPAVFSWGELYNTPVGRGVLVAFERDGAPLRDGEGRIALVSSADERPGPRHVKWLNRIEVRRVPE
jgi:hypothetical protein